MGCPALELAGHWVELGLSVEMEISGRALADWYYRGPGGLLWSSVLNSALPPQRLSPDTCLGHQDPVSHMSAASVVIIVALFLSQHLSMITYTLFLLNWEKLKESWWEQEEPQSQLMFDSNEVKTVRTPLLLRPALTFSAHDLPHHHLKRFCLQF